MVQGQGWHFSYLIFQGFSFLHLEIALCKTALCIWKKIIFFCHHNFMKKVILSYLKTNLKTSH